MTGVQTCALPIYNLKGDTYDTIFSTCVLEKEKGINAFTNIQVKNKPSEVSKEQLNELLDIKPEKVEE